MVNSHLNPIHVISAISCEVTLKLTSYSLKSTKITMHGFDVSHKWNHVHNWFMYSHSQWLFYEFISNFTNKLVKQSLRVTVYFAYDPSLVMLFCVNYQSANNVVANYYTSKMQWSMTSSAILFIFQKWRYYYVIQNFFDWCFSKNLHKFVECIALKVYDEPFIFFFQKKNLGKKVFCIRIIPK